MQVRMTITVAVDAEAWGRIYGPETEGKVQADVFSYVCNLVDQSAASEGQALRFSAGQLHDRIDHPRCTFIVAVGEWPFTNPPRCGQPARYRIADEYGDEGYSCEPHAQHVLGGARGVTVIDMWGGPL